MRRRRRPGLRRLLPAAFVFASAAALSPDGAFAAPPPQDAVQADFARGLALDLGQDGHPDAAAAFAFYLRAARQNLPDAAFNVAVLYDSGRGVPHDAASAARWYAAAAAWGVRRAAYDLGLLYEHGDGVPRDAVTARAWYRRAAGEGVTAARPRLRDRMVQEPGQAPGANAAKPVAPAAGSMQMLAVRPAALVWQPAPGTSRGSTYYVEVTSLDHAGEIVFEGQTDVTALSTGAPLPAGNFAWRVFTIEERPARYVQSGWIRFSVAAAAQK